MVGVVSTQPNLTPHTRVQSSLSTRSLVVGDELIVLDVLHDRSFRLNVTASRIWHLLQEPRSISDIGKLLTADLPADGEEVSAMVTEHVRELNRLGLADISN